MKTGGPNWQRQNLQPSTITPMQQPQPGSVGRSADWSSGLQAGHFPAMGMQNQMARPPTMMGVQPMGVQPMGGGMGMMQQQPMMMQQPGPFMVMREGRIGGRECSSQGPLW